MSQPSHLIYFLLLFTVHILPQQLLLYGNYTTKVTKRNTDTKIEVIKQRANKLPTTVTPSNIKPMHVTTEYPKNGCYY